MILNELGEKGINNVLQRRLNMVGSAPAPALMPEVGGNIVLENDRAEYKRWKGEIPFRLFDFIGAIAGETAACFIPPSRGNVVVIEQVTVTVSCQYGWGVQPGFTLPISIANAFAADNSAAPFPLPLSSFGGTCVVSPPFLNGGAALLEFAPAGATIVSPIVMWPNNPALVIRSGAPNTSLLVQLRGYLRKLTPNELG